MTDPIIDTDAWRRGATAAKQQTADIVSKVDVPVSYTTAALSILASPHINNWSVECRQWLADKTARTVDAFDSLPDADVELDPAKHWTDWNVS